MFDQEGGLCDFTVVFFPSRLVSFFCTFSLEALLMVWLALTLGGKVLWELGWGKIMNYFPSSTKEEPQLFPTL